MLKKAEKKVQNPTPIPKPDPPAVVPNPQKPPEKAQPFLQELGKIHPAPPHKPDQQAKPTPDQLPPVDRQVSDDFEIDPPYKPYPQAKPMPGQQPPVDRQVNDDIQMEPPLSEEQKVVATPEAIPKPIDKHQGVDNGKVPPAVDKSAIETLEREIERLREDSGRLRDILNKVNIETLFEALLNSVHLSRQVAGEGTILEEDIKTLRELNRQAFAQLELLTTIKMDPVLVCKLQAARTLNEGLHSPDGRQNRVFKSSVEHTYGASES